ncbi:keratin, type I cytoskeletal 18 isoform X3 [Myripristis murdjan]|uniref:keratin, type I cytoskeletal 18 isoform X3 n=1 Tax=Myripristis murdjan TaxID=586833 RepID=UPI0011761A0E|nr:keratin, type I cytoskeletal 18-like isoform X3 [Myripristis murdjan]
MPKNSSASMFGGAGGRDSRASVGSLEGLRNMMRSEPGKDSAPHTAAAPAPAPGDKKTMRDLNERLSGYLGRVRQLERANQELEDQINDILAKRGAPEDRDWEEIEKPLADLRKKIKDKVMNNAKLLLQINNAKLANDDFKSKLEAEKQARRILEQDLAALKKEIDDTQLKRVQLENQIESLKDELALHQKDHKDEVDALREKIKDSSVVVEMDSQDSNLAETLNKIRAQYEKLAKKNQKETEDWYQNKFDNIKVEVALNTEALQTGRTELNDLCRQRQLLEIDIQAMLSMIHSLEETLKETKGRGGREMARLNQILLGLEDELTRVRSQVERQVDDYQNLLHVKMKLEAEISNYRQLMRGLAADEDRPARA